MLALPLSDVDRAWAGREFPELDDWLAKDRPSQFDGGNFLEDLASRNAGLPILHLTGWWDGAAGGVQRNWARMRAAGGTRQWLVYGFWPHSYAHWSGRGGSRYADVEYGPAAAFDFQALYLRWFDTWLKGRDVGLEQVPRVQVFMTGANRWLSFDDWSPRQTREVAFHLSSGERPGSGVGTLSERAPPAAAKPLVYRYDPARVRADRDINFGRTTKLWFSPRDGDNVLFQTDPLPADLDLVGAVEVDLSISTSAADTDFFALLVDIDPRGQRRAVTLPGKMRARYVHGWETPGPLEPGRVYRVTFPLRDVAHRFPKGHRLALAVRSEWCPSFARNLNTMEPTATATRATVAVNSIHGSPAHPSTLRLRVLSPGASP